MFHLLDSDTFVKPKISNFNSVPSQSGLKKPLHDSFTIFENGSREVFCSEFLEMSLPLPNRDQVVLISVGSVELSKELTFRLKKYGFNNIVIID